MRYPKPTRLKLYSWFIEHLKEALGCKDLSPLAPPTLDTPLFYFCMERWDIWEDLLGASPESIQELDFLFARSLSSRFHHNLAPQEKKYYHL